MKVNFQKIKIYAGINRKTYQTVDVRESFANLLYTSVNGIRAHALALKIYNGEGEMVFNPEETRLILYVANKFCTPSFIDGLQEQLEGGDV